MGQGGSADEDEDTATLCRALAADGYGPELSRVLATHECELEPDFLGFTDQYEHLAAIIPKHWTVLDLGCNLAVQAWYFRDHKRYIGVDAHCDVMDRFQTPNGEHVRCLIDEYIVRMAQLPQSTFAICNYVPTNTAALRAACRNLFVFYPEHDPAERPPWMRERLAVSLPRLTPAE